MVILNVVFLDAKPDPKEEALLSLNATFLGKLQKAVRITHSNVLITIILEEEIFWRIYQISYSGGFKFVESAYNCLNFKPLYLWV